MERETLVSFGSDAEAEVARSMLEGEGIGAWIERDASGRAALQVASKDLSRARAFFLREDGEEADATVHLRHHPDALEIAPRDRKARRAWFTAWTGTVVWALVMPLPWRAALLLPVAAAVWSLWLLGDVFFSRGPLGRRWRTLSPVTAALDLGSLLAIGLMLRGRGG